MSTLKRESFELSKVKTLDRESVEVEGFEVRVEGSATHRIKHKQKMPITPHPDLLNAIDRLKDRFWSYFGWNSLVTITEDNRFNANEEQKRLINGTVEVIKNTIKITGITFSGKERNKIIITGTVGGCALNTKALGFKNPDYGEELQEIADLIEDEVFEYAFNNKRSQLSMAFGEEVKDGKAAAAGEDLEDKED